MCVFFFLMFACDWASHVSSPKVVSCLFLLKAVQVQSSDALYTALSQTHSSLGSVENAGRP